MALNSILPVPPFFHDQPAGVRVAYQLYSVRTDMTNYLRPSKKSSLKVSSFSKDNKINFMTFHEKVTQRFLEQTRCTEL